MAVLILFYIFLSSAHTIIYSWIQFILNSKQKLCFSLFPWIIIRKGEKEAVRDQASVDERGSRAKMIMSSRYASMQYHFPQYFIQQSKPDKFLQTRTKIDMHECTSMYKAIEALSEPLGSFNVVIASNIRLSNLQPPKFVPINQCHGWHFLHKQTILFHLSPFKQ